MHRHSSPADRGRRPKPLAVLPPCFPARTERSAQLSGTSVTKSFQRLSWYSWVDSNHRPPDPQSGALNQLSYSCTCRGFCFAHDLFRKPVSTFRDHAQAAETYE
jgi:hypothetical protein